MRKQLETVFFPTLLEIHVQDNGDGTWTAMLDLPIGDGRPYTCNTMPEAVKYAAAANALTVLPGEFVSRGAAKF